MARMGKKSATRFSPTGCASRFSLTTSTNLDINININLNLNLNHNLNSNPNLKKI